MDELKPCPFCGSKVKLVGECDMLWARCTNYDCQAERININKFDEPEDAAEDWNKRAEELLNETDTANATRRIDDLGRVVIPKQIRNMCGINEGDMLEIIIYPSAGGVFIKPAKNKV